MTEYEVSVKSKIIVGKEGSKLEEIDIKADSFRDPYALERFKESYNEGKEIEEVKYKEKNWKKSIYENLYRSWIIALKKWKKVTLKKRNRKKNRKKYKKDER